MLTKASGIADHEWSRGRSTPARLVLRAEDCPVGGEGDENKEMARELTNVAETIGRWRRRFVEKGCWG